MRSKVHRQLKVRIILTFHKMLTHKNNLYAFYLTSKNNY